MLESKRHKRITKETHRKTKIATEFQKSELYLFSFKTHKKQNTFSQAFEKLCSIMMSVVKIQTIKVEALNSECLPKILRCLLFIIYC